MARAGKARAGTGPAEDEHASGGDLSMSPSASSTRASRTPTTGTTAGTSKKRKRADDWGTQKRSKRTASGSASAGDAAMADGEGTVHDKHTVKLEEAEEAMDEDTAALDHPEFFLQPADAARILLVLER